MKKLLTVDFNDRKQVKDFIETVDYQDTLDDETIDGLVEKFIEAKDDEDIIDFFERMYCEILFSEAWGREE